MGAVIEGRDVSGGADREAPRRRTGTRARTVLDWTGAARLVAVSHAHGPVQVVGTAQPAVLEVGRVACMAGADGAARRPTATEAASSPSTIAAAIAKPLKPVGGI